MSLPGNVHNLGVKVQKTDVAAEKRARLGCRCLETWVSLPGNVHDLGVKVQKTRVAAWKRARLSSLTGQKRGCCLETCMGTCQNDVATWKRERLACETAKNHVADWKRAGVGTSLPRNVHGLRVNVQKICRRARLGTSTCQKGRRCARLGTSTCQKGRRCLETCITWRVYVPKTRLVPRNVHVDSPRTTSLPRNANDLPRPFQQMCTTWLVKGEARNGTPTHNEK